MYLLPSVGNIAVHELQFATIRKASAPKIKVAGEYLILNCIYTVKIRRYRSDVILDRLRFEPEKLGARLRFA